MRSTAEWIAKHDDEAIPPRVRLRVWDRFGGRCACCSRKINAGEKWEADHATALVNGGSHRESNLQLLCAWCHSSKTKADVAQKAVTYSKRKANLGIKKPRKITRWRKFDGSIREVSRER
jgi:5-methylcytosine-specific restriction endonuclease McrA